MPARDRISYSAPRGIEAVEQADPVSLASLGDSPAVRVGWHQVREGEGNEHRGRVVIGVAVEGLTCTEVPVDRRARLPRRGRLRRVSAT